jgi:hypothetical protein
MRKYAEDYELERKEDEKERIKKTAKYVGEYYEVNVELQDLIRFRRVALLFLVLILGLHIGAGFVGNQGMYQFYVALPYVFVFLPLYYFASGILRLPKDKRPYRRDEVELTFERIKKANWFLFGLFCMVILGELVFLVWFSKGGQNQELIFLASEAVAAIPVALIWRSQKSINIKKIDED